MARRSPLPARPAPVVRTCIGCRTRAAKSDLLRVVLREGEAVPDPRARLPGRGAYVHPSRACFELALRRRAFARALRVPGTVVLDKLEEHLALRCGGPPAGSAAQRAR